MLQIRRLFGELNKKVHERQKERDKIQKIYRFWVAVYWMMRRHFKKFGPNLSIRAQNKIRQVLSLQHNIKRESQQEKAKMILKQFFKDRTEVIYLKEWFIKFGKEIYEYNQDVKNRLIPGAKKA